MAVERTPAGSSLVDVLDRVLDKGIVIDAYVRVTLVGIDLIGVEARIVVASVDTYLRYSDQMSHLPSLSRPAAVDGRSDEVNRLTAENRELRRRIEVVEAGNGKGAGASDESDLGTSGAN